MTELRELYRRAASEFGHRVETIGDDAWRAPTPCTEWDVRALVNHLVGENLWAPELLAGRTVAEVGDRFDGDVLGDDPKGAWRASIAAALDAADEPDALDRTVHLSFGDVPGSEYVTQLTTDLTIHAWDLAKGLGGDDALDDELVAFVWDTWLPRAEMVRSAGVFGDDVPVAEDADLQTRVLGFFGRRRDWAPA